MTKYICIHGHFYQPPRENPWLELIEVQDSAHPFHDWNERINRECYAPNTMSRLLDESGRIRKIVNNFESISFNIGPTLFSWLEKFDTQTYERIIEADRASVTRFDGHGSAIAQAYNHMIMPLASKRDRQTQIKWGIADFEKRFGRFPEGMWLPETAACKETLADLYDNGIKFTVLAQSQAKAIKEPGSDKFVEANGVDPTRSYRVDLGDGKSIAVFFYDGPISRAVAFERLLSSGDTFANRLKSGFSAKRDWPQLLSIATDGETFGHHHRFGEMALASALEIFEKEKNIEVINYSAYLAKYPPEATAIIHDNSAWSCAHGVERWKSDCGCSIGAGDGWRQQWRAPLREAFDYLKKILDEVYEEEAGRFFKNPWDVRNQFIDVILDRDETEKFVIEHVEKEIDHDDMVEVLTLLEMQRNGMLMYTSCGWFFDDISGIETIQILKYAARAIQLLESITGQSPEELFVNILAKAESNLVELSDGKSVWNRYVLPERAKLSRVAADYAISSTLKIDDAFRPESYLVEENGKAEESFGENGISLFHIVVRSRLTLHERQYLVACLKLGRTDITSFAKPCEERADFYNMENKIIDTWRHKPITDVIRTLDDYFGKDGATYALRDLFVEPRREAVARLASDQIERFSDTYKALFSDNRRVMDYFIESGVPIPGEFKLSAQYIMEQELLAATNSISENGDLDKIVDLMGDIHRWNLTVNLTQVSNKIEKRLSALVEDIITHRHKSMTPAVVRALLALQASGLKIDLWRLQNLFSGAYFGREYSPEDTFYQDRDLKKLGIMLNFSYKKKN